MSIKTRLQNLERMTGCVDWVPLRPRDVSAEQWAAIGEQLRVLPDTEFAPWKNYADVVEWLGRVRPASLIDCPDVVLACLAEVVR